ncbi:MAG: heme-binding domain-containing protein [Cyclobacteriaceae bacterium]|nr:heme-binding domain-containing protein [Cyclobacteriaceae bacterium]
MNKRIRKTSWVVLITLIAIQLIPIDTSNPVEDSADTFLTATSPDDEVRSILNKACMDCHSFNTVYPWYSHIAPISWWLVDHIDEGREHLNLSTWAQYDAKKKDHKLEEFAEEVEEHEMPLNSYTWMHPEARLTEEQRGLLVDWVKKIRAEKTY